MLHVLLPVGETLRSSIGAVGLVTKPCREHGEAYVPYMVNNGAKARVKRLRLTVAHDQSTSHKLRSFSLTRARNPP